MHRASHARVMAERGRVNAPPQMGAIKAKYAADGIMESTAPIHERRVGTSGAPPSPSPSPSSSSSSSPAAAADAAAADSLRGRVTELEEALQRMESQLRRLSPGGEGADSVVVGEGASTSHEPRAWRRWGGAVWRGTVRHSAAAWRACRPWLMTPKHPDPPPPEAA